MQPPSTAVGDFVVIPVPGYALSGSTMQHAIERQQHEWHEAVGRARSSPIVRSSSADPSPMRSPRGHASPMPVPARTPASGRSTGGSERTQRGTPSHGSMGASRARPVTSGQREGGRWNGAPLTAPAPFSAAGAPPACTLSGGGGSAAGAPSELHMPPPHNAAWRRQQAQRDTLTQAVGLAETQAAESAVREALLRSEVGGTEAALAQAANALRGARGERNNLAQQLSDLNQRLRAAQAERAALAPSQRKLLLGHGDEALGRGAAGARRAGGLKGGSGTGGGARKGGGGGGGGGGGSTTASDGEFDEARGMRYGARSQRHQPPSATDGTALEEMGRTHRAELAGLREQAPLPGYHPMLPGYHPSWQGKGPVHP